MNSLKTIQEFSKDAGKYSRTTRCFFKDQGHNKF